MVGFTNALGQTNSAGNVFVSYPSSNTVDTGNALEINIAGLEIKPILTVNRPNPPLGMFVNYRDDIVPGSPSLPNDVFLSINGEGLLKADLIDFDGDTWGCDGACLSW